MQYFKVAVCSFRVSGRFRLDDVRFPHVELEGTPEPLEGRGYSPRLFIKVTLCLKLQYSKKRERTQNCY